MLKSSFLRFCLLLLMIFGSAMPLQAKTLKVIAGTSLIADIVLDLTENQAEVVTVVKGSSCPGHETAKTTDFVFAAQADMVLVHFFQRGMPWLTDMLEAVQNKNLLLVTLNPKGSWLIPAVQKRAALDIATALTQADPENAKAINARLHKRLARVDSAGDEILAKLAPLKGRPVAAAIMQSEFVAWAGLTVLSTHGRAEDMHPRGIARMVDELRDKQLAGVIDNYQSGSDAGLPLALELKVPHVVISNFPGSNDNNQDYFSLLNDNASQLLRMGG